MKKLPLLMLLLTLVAFNETYSQRVITGTVQSSNNSYLVGATVALKNSKTSTISNSEGQFEIQVPTGKVILEVSYVGYESKSIPVAANQSNVSVILTQSLESQLTDVVVIGYGTRQKGELTGAVSKVDSKVFEDRPATNILDAMQGAMPGVTVTRSSGQPGEEGYSVQIRGASSMSGSKPLVLVDGVPGDLGLLNPNDISDITVLKDAAASIYGARAADGVILVTTKKGKKGKISLSYSGNYGLKTPQFLKKMTSTLHMAEMYDKGMRNVGQPGVPDSIFAKIRAGAPPDVSSGWLKYLENFPGFYGSHDWNTTVYGTGVEQSHNIGISGGGDNNSYYFSAGYKRDGGIFKWGENHSDRYNLRLNYDFNLFDRLNIQTRTSFENQHIATPSALDLVLYLLPKIGSYVPLYNPLGEYYKYQGGFRNPPQYLEQAGLSNSDDSKFSTNVTADLKILSNLKLVAQMGVNLDFDYNNATHPSFDEYNWDGSLFDVVNNPNSANYSNSKNLYKIFSAHLDYNKTFFDKHLFNLMVGASHEKNDVSGQSINGYNFASNEIFTLNLADRTQTKYADFTGNATDWALQSYFGRFSYSYNRKYLLDFTTRVDGSSKFAPSKRWSAVFPSIALAWNLSEEKFLQSIKPVNSLKLRLSWGQAGNEELATSNYGYIPLISITGNGYPLGSPNVGLPGAVSSIASPERTWETIETKNVGLDFTMINSKLAGSFNYYVKSNHDMLVNVQLPATLGGVAPMQNVGELSTKGWDFSIGWSDKLGDFKYSVSAMISDSKNKLVKLKGSSSYSEGLVFAREGYPLNSYFGYQFEGIIKNSKQLEDYKKLGNVPANLDIGDVMYKDIDGDGKITAFGDPSKGTKGDMIYLGNLLPRYPYSLRLDLSYKRFDLGIFIQGVGHRDGVVTGESAYAFTQVWNQPLEYFYGKEYSSDNPDAKYPRIIPGALGADVLRDWNWRYSAMRVNNYAYLKLKVLTVAYNIPQSLYSKLKMQSARIYFSGTDLFTLSKGTWNNTFNPEEIWTTRTDELTYPFSSVISFGIDIRF